MLPGRVAQLVERAPEKREVTGSTPVPTTTKIPSAHRLRAASAAVALLVVAGVALAAGDDESNSDAVRERVPSTTAVATTTLVATTTSVAPAPADAAPPLPHSVPTTVIAIVGGNDAPTRLVVLDTRTGRELRTLVEEPATRDHSLPIWDASLAPDGETVWYVRYARSRACPLGTIERVPFAGGVPTVVVEGSSAALSRDGRRLAYVGADSACHTYLAVRELASGVERRWPGRTQNEGPGICCDLRWAPDSRRLAYVMTHVDSHDAWVLDTTTAPRALPAGRKVSPDDRHEWKLPAFRDDGTLLVRGQRWDGEKTRTVIADVRGAVLVALEEETITLDTSGPHLLMVLSEWPILTEGPPVTRLVRHDGTSLTEIATGVAASAWGPRG